MMSDGFKLSVPPPYVTAVILNWNNYADSKDCLQSLTAATYQNLRVTVVDNGSSDGSGAKLQAAFPQYQFIMNQQNLGFSRGCNAGIRAALADTHLQYILLLNNDFIVEPGFLELGVAAAESDPRIGAVSGKVLMRGNRLWYAGGHVRVWRAGVWARGLGEEDRGQYDRTERVGFATGGMMLIPRHILENVGLLPEEYFFGFEEYDYSATLLRAGYSLLYEPRFKAFHRVSGSHHNWGPKYLYNNYRNKMIFARKFLPRLALPFWRIAFILYTRWFSDRWRRRWVAKYSYTGETVPHPERFNFALREALADEGRKRPLDEDALTDYDRRWKLRCQTLGLPECP